MKKKILLLPITLLSSFLSACTYRTEFIPLEEIYTIDREDNAGYYYYEDTEYCDYCCDMFNILKTYTSNAELIKKIDDSIPYRGNNIKSIYYRFYINDSFKKMDYFTITAYDTGDIEVRVSGADWPMSPENQNTLYKIDEKTTTDLFSAVASYVEDMEATLKEEEGAAEEASKIDNFFTAYSNLPNKKVTYAYIDYEPRESRQRVREIDIPDKDGDILESLVGLEYKIRKDNGGYIYVDSSNSIRVAVNDGWRMTLDYMNATGFVYYEYVSKYNGPSVYSYSFTVNSIKIETLQKKLYSKIKDQIQ